MLSDEQRQTAAVSLFNADKDRKTISQLSKTYPEMTIEDSYDVHCNARRCDAMIHHHPIPLLLFIHSSLVYCL